MRVPVEPGGVGSRRPVCAEYTTGLGALTAAGTLPRSVFGRLSSGEDVRTGFGGGFGGFVAGGGSGAVPRERG